jgi:hypothetical protein
MKYMVIFMWWHNMLQVEVLVCGCGNECSIPSNKIPNLVLNEYNMITYVVNDCNMSTCVINDHIFLFEV